MKDDGSDRALYHKKGLIYRDGAGATTQGSIVDIITPIESNAAWDIGIVPSSNDVVPVRNQVLEIDTLNLSVTGAADSIAAGTSDGGTQYATSSSYN